MDRPPDIELVELRDAAETAERAVAHWQAKVRSKLAAAQDLTGFLPWLAGTVTGTRQQQLDDAVAAVERARARLDQAKRTRDEALARLAGVEQDRVDVAAAEEARRARREAIADQIRGAVHPLADQFNDVEARLDAVQIEHDAVLEAFTAGTGLAAAIKSTLRTIESATPQNARSDHRRYTPTIAESRMQRLESQADAFEMACAAMGLSMSVHIALPPRDRMGEIVRRWGHSLVAGAMAQSEAFEFHASLQSAIDETEGALDPMQRQLAQLRDELDDLQRQRDALIDQVSRTPR